ncbi:hypothetical protein OKW42_005493 [Paraburkholderia sp. WC7.3d]
MVRVKAMSVRELPGILKPGVSVDVEDMDPWRDLR